MATEAFRILRDTFSAAEITLVCGSWNVAGAEKSGYFDKVIPFDFFPEDDSARTVTASREALLESFAKCMERQTFELAVDLRLFEDSRRVLEIIKATDRAGFDRYDSFPWLTIRLNTPSATEDDRAEERIIAADQFRTSLGQHRTFEIRSESSYNCRNNETVIWGPYQELCPGRYRFDCLIEPLGEEFEVSFDIAVNSGAEKLLTGRLPVRFGSHPSVQLNLPKEIKEFELRLQGNAGRELKPFRFMGIRLIHQGVIRGIHQSEAMTLLAHLVRLRMVNRYATALL